MDLLIIGGGITGCGIALDAASRGLRVALLEKNDFASGTSSRSTKLIHGGLRYLKKLEFGLVKEVGSERAVVHSIAPHLVVPEKMLLPLYEKRGLGYWLTSFGLRIYDWLAGVKREDQRKMLTRNQALRAEPLLDGQGVRGGALYAEYRTDDARLTIEIAKTAARHSAILLSYCKVVGFATAPDGSINGVNAVDVLTETKFAVRARSVVNAAGPWVDEIRQADGSLEGKRLHLSKGVHVVVPIGKLPVTQAIYFDVVDDNRMIFAIPRGRTTYIGTTDTSFEGKPDNVRASLDDARYLLNAVNHTFAGAVLTFEDIESSWAGLRPLIHEEGRPASDLSRKDEIFVSPSGLISIAGGKLTGYRKMAERVVNLVIKRSFPDRQFNPCCTSAIRLVPGGPVDLRDANLQRNELIKLLQQFGLAEPAAYNLFELFGANAFEISEDLRQQSGRTDSTLDLLKAELRYCLEEEMVCSAPDFFVRRTGLLYFDIKRVIQYAEDIIQEMAAALQWDEKRMNAERRLIQDLINHSQLKSPSST